MYATDMALVRLLGDTTCFTAPLAPWSMTSESCHKLPADTRSGSLLFSSCRLIRLRSVVYISCLVLESTSTLLKPHSFLACFCTFPRCVAASSHATFPRTFPAQSSAWPALLSCASSVENPAFISETGRLTSTSSSWKRTDRWHKFAH